MDKKTDNIKINVISIISKLGTGGVETLINI